MYIYKATPTPKPIIIFLPIVCNNIAAANHAPIKGINRLAVNFPRGDDGHGIVFDPTLTQYIG